MMNNALSSIQAKLKNGQVELSSDEYESLNQILQNGADMPFSSSGGLVRCRGMVQDMMDPEYYYQGGEDNDLTDLVGQLGERQPLLLVPMPFASKWTRGADDETSDITRKESKKRERDESLEEEESSKKQSTGSPNATMDFSSSIQSRDNTSKPWSWPPGYMGSNPKETPVVCQLYYDIHKGPKLRLNDVVEVIGILDPVEARAPIEEGQSFLQEDPFFEEEEDLLPSMLPRLHAVCYRKIDLEDLSDTTEPMEVDQTLKSIFTAALGSETAAEALLLSLYSQAEREMVNAVVDAVAAPVKTPYDTTLGCASLNFILPTIESCNAAATHLQSLLQEVLPVVGRINLDDKGIVSPVKMGAHLVPSALQLPKGAMLILVDNRTDESLEASETLDALSTMTKNHSVPYRFDGGMRFNFEADYRILVLSAKNPSELLPCTLTMKLPHQISSRPNVSQNSALQLRSQLAKGRQSNVVLGHQLLEVAQQDFVDRRQQARDLNSKLAGEDDFHRWLTLTRLCARVEEREDASMEDWKNALRLDDAMRKV